jgi:hypothetical protein
MVSALTGHDAVRSWERRERYRPASRNGRPERYVAIKTQTSQFAFGYGSPVSSRPLNYGLEAHFRVL